VTVVSRSLAAQRRQAAGGAAGWSPYRPASEPFAVVEADPGGEGMLRKPTITANPNPSGPGRDQRFGT